jgi:hypothetical protein
MTPAQIADALGRGGSGVRMRLSKMLKAGDIVKCANGRYRTEAPL